MPVERSRSATFELLRHGSARRALAKGALAHTPPDGGIRSARLAPCSPASKPTARRQCSGQALRAPARGHSAPSHAYDEGPWSNSWRKRGRWALPSRRAAPGPARVVTASHQGNHLRTGHARLQGCQEKTSSGRRGWRTGTRSFSGRGNTRRADQGGVNSDTAPYSRLRSLMV